MRRCAACGRSPGSTARSRCAPAGRGDSTISRAGLPASKRPLGQGQGVPVRTGDHVPLAAARHVQVPVQRDLLRDLNAGRPAGPRHDRRPTIGQEGSGLPDNSAYRGRPGTQNCELDLPPFLRARRLPTLRSPAPTLLTSIRIGKNTVGERQDRPDSFDTRQICPDPMSSCVATRISFAPGTGATAGP